MKIKSLKLNNFRQFKDFEIEFDISDPNKNITVIRAQNSTGKTTLVQSIKWCLYGEDAVELDKTTEYINSDEVKFCRASDQKNSEYSVSLEVLHKDTYYNITRRQKVSINNFNVKNEAQEIKIEYIDDSGELQVTKNLTKEHEKLINKKINSMMNKQMANYFLFDGERIEKISEKGSKSRNEIDAAITSVSKLPVLYNCLDTLTRLKKEIRRETATMSKDIKVQDIESKITANETLIAKEKEKVAALEDDYKHKEKELDRIEKDLSEIKSITELIQRQKDLKQRITINNQKREKLYLDIQTDFVTYEYSKYIYLLSKKYNKINLNEETREKTIPNMEVRALEKIIENGVCICGTELTDKHIHHIEEQKRYQPPISKEGMILNYNMAVNSETAGLNALVRTIKNNIKAYKEVVSEISKFTHEIEEIDKNLDKSKSDRVSEFNQARKEAQTDLNKVYFNLTTSKVAIENAEKQIKEDNKKFESYKAMIKVNALMDMKSKLIESSLLELNGQINADKKKLKADIQKYANKHFKEIIAKEKNIVITDTFGYMITDEYNRETSTSSGESVAVSFSIILAIIDTHINNVKNKAKNDLLVEEDYFMVMDGPFAVLDQFFSSSISKKISESLEQIILLTNDNQYTESIRGAFEDRLSKEYLLTIPEKERQNRLITSDLKEVIS